jgi:hypothetical protein
MGRAIGQEVAKKLDFHYYDRELIESASPIVGDTIETLSEFDGHMFGNSFDRMMYPLGFGKAKKQKQLFEVEKSIIIEHANYENCVIIGRCADNILKERRNHFSIFIFAPYEVRLKNCQEELNLSKEQAVNYIAKVDRAREEFYALITGDEFDGVNNRQLLIDSSLLGKEGTADLIVALAKAKFKL